MIADVALFRNNGLRRYQVQFEQLLYLLLDFRRADILDLWELIHDEVLNILGSPDAVFAGQAVEDKSGVLTIRNTQKDGLVSERGRRLDRINHMLLERIYLVARVLGWVQLGGLLSERLVRRLKRSLRAFISI